MKKIVIAIIILAIAAGGAYFFNSQQSNLKTAKDNEAKDIMTSKIQVVEFEDMPAKKITAGNDDSAEAVEANDDGTKLELDVVDDEDLERRLEAKEEEFDRLEEEWLKNVKELFISELGLTEREYKDYLNMREGLFNDKVSAFEEMHEQLEEKYGENYTYNPTEEEMAFDREIQKKYDDLLLEKVGKDAFIKYLELRDRTNERILESTKANDAAMLMEF
ncbi:hypothetical protein M902_2323 [Bacteriovorax sp. BAL6_X]|uniref:hypothetical protein n=1 Tax=Bacteriovorax sp. BAL6_X TaxID=1201290 RepID=UPI000385BAE9|nr:hypothetical protein [Bacteriovorax sp. BAL6_X]EPZ51875.1 hypothetical protein M902_2323 [Bacteriovorax sp. BAL6_X]